MCRRDPRKTSKKLEKIQTDFARSILGLTGCQSIPNDIIRSEMGLERLQSRWEKLRLGYWRRINVASDDRNLKSLAMLRKFHLGHKGGTFATGGYMQGTRNLLEKRGIGRHWNPNVLVHQIPM